MLPLLAVAGLEDKGVAAAGAGAASAGAGVASADAWGVCGACELLPCGIEAEARGVNEPATRFAADATADEASVPIPRGVNELRAKSADGAFTLEVGGVCGERGALSPGSTPGGGQLIVSFPRRGGVSSDSAATIGERAVG